MMATPARRAEVMAWLRDRAALMDPEDSGRPFVDDAVEALEAMEELLALLSTPVRTSLDDLPRLRTATAPRNVTVVWTTAEDVLREFWPTEPFAVELYEAGNGE